VTLETGVMRHDELLLLPKGFVVCRIEKGVRRLTDFSNHGASFQSKRQISQLALMVIFFFFC